MRIPVENWSGNRGYEDWNSAYEMRYFLGNRASLGFTSRETKGKVSLLAVK
jgi:hypothetical protein